MISKAESESFVTELREVCRRHNLSIGHEDSHGAFQVWPFDEQHDAWLAGAYVPDEHATAPPTPPARMKLPNPNTHKEG